jgi:hypothetical protein
MPDPDTPPVAPLSAAERAELQRWRRIQRRMENPGRTHRADADTMIYIAELEAERDELAEELAVHVRVVEADIGPDAVDQVNGRVAAAEAERNRAVAEAAALRTALRDLVADGPAYEVWSGDDFRCQHCKATTPLIHAPAAHRATCVWAVAARALT